MDFINTYSAKIHDWAAQSVLNGLVVHVAGAILGVILTVYGVKYLPPQVIIDITHAIANVDVYNATPIDPVK